MLFLNKATQDLRGSDADAEDTALRVELKRPPNLSDSGAELKGRIRSTLETGRTTQLNHNDVSKRYRAREYGHG